MFLIYGHLDYFAVSPTQISWNFLKIQLVPAQASGLAMFFFGLKTSRPCPPPKHLWKIYLLDIDTIF